MSRRRGPRSRQRDTKSNQSQRLLQVVLVGAGVLFLLVGLVIAVGIPSSFPGLSSSTNGGAQTADSGTTPTPQPADTETMAQQSGTTQEDTATAETDPTTETTTETTTEAPSGMSIVDTTDADGDGHVSDFDIRVIADTRLPNADDDVKPYVTVSFNDRRPLEQDGYLKQDSGQEINIPIEPSFLKQYKRGPLKVTVSLMADHPAKDDKKVKSWSETIKFEPEREDEKE